VVRVNAYGSEFHDDVVQVQHEGPDSFGSGRLIGRNLVLTARHVVEPGGAIVDTGWKIRRIGDRPQDWPKSPWIWLGANVLYVAEAHDLAVLRLSAPASLTPFYRTRVATAKARDERPVEGAGFPSGFADEGRIKLLAATGELQDDAGPTLIFNVVSASQPDDPHSDWQGFSGSAIVHRGVLDPKDLWIYGVAQQVPANFTKKIEVARLAEALSDPKLRELLVGAGLEKLAPADPCLLPAAKDFPDIVKLREFAETRLKTAGVPLMDTRATLCPSFDELEKLHRGGSSADETLSPADLLAKYQSGGALLVKAPGGFGKSFYLLRMTLAAMDEGMLPFFLDLRGTELKLIGAPDEDSCDELFKKASRRAVKWDILRKARDKALGIFVAVDGLNEALTPDAIERTLAYLLKEFGDRLVLAVTDRMSERPLQFSTQLCTILPLSPAVVAKRLPNLNLDLLGDSFKYLLSIPFFLALYGKIAGRAHAADARPLFQTRSEMLFAYFALCQDSQIGADDMQEAGQRIVAKLAPVAFEGYRRGGVRMDAHWLSDELKKSNSQGGGYPDRI